MSEDEELAALSAAMIPRVFFAARWSAGYMSKLVPTVSATATFTLHTPAPVYRIALALRDLKASVRSEDSGDGVRLSGHLGSGFHNMNPTVFVITIGTTSVDDTAEVRIRSAAKEGLIKQRSAQRVIDRLRVSLADVIVPDLPQ